MECVRLLVYKVTMDCKILENPRKSAIKLGPGRVEETRPACREVIFEWNLEPIEEPLPTSSTEELVSAPVKFKDVRIHHSEHLLKV